MKRLLMLAVMASFSCNQVTHYISSEELREKEVQKIMGMISAREQAMKLKSLEAVMGQFSEDATWINSQGYLFEGKQVIQKFHKMMFNNDSLDYIYIAGTPKVRILDNRNALAYYGWKMLWINRLNRPDTIKREIGLMTLTAQKSDSSWQWKAITNQHTPWFYGEINPVPVE